MCSLMYSGPGWRESPAGKAGASTILIFLAFLVMSSWSSEVSMRSLMGASIGIFLMRYSSGTLLKLWDRATEDSRSGEVSHSPHNASPMAEIL